MKIAFLIATRSCCLRKNVGAVVVRDNRILTTGYNGTPPGMQNCTPATCLNLPSGEKCPTIHAEQNAVGYAAHVGAALRGATMYITAFPCEECFRITQAAGIREIVYAEPYKIHRATQFLYQNTQLTLREFYPSAVRSFVDHLLGSGDSALKAQSEV